MPEKDLLHFDSEQRQLVCRGDWTIRFIPQIKILLDKISWPASGQITINGKAISKMDSASAWLLYKLQNKLEKKGLKVKLEEFSPPYQTLISIVAKQIDQEKELQKPRIYNFLARLGRQIIPLLHGFMIYLTFIGHLTMEALRIISQPKRLRWNSFASVIYRSGYEALPIIALLSFMIGIVITYQMGLQLRSYGANVYIVDLLGISILREFGPLLTAIMVAGRTGSAFTAQLGIMKLNQEIDALDTIGVTPAELLLLPRIAGLFISLPLITMWANIFGVFGGMVMANNMLNISWYDFLHRFPNVIPLRALLIGMGKAPVFALIIASIGCYQGMRVKGNADSVGQNTTKSVVTAIFFIIVADAIFSIIFSKLKL